MKLAALCAVSRSTAPEMLWSWVDYQSTLIPVLFVDGANVRAPARLSETLWPFMHVTEGSGEVSQPKFERQYIETLQLCIHNWGVSLVPHKALNASLGREWIHNKIHNTYALLEWILCYKCSIEFGEKIIFYLYAAILPLSPFWNRNVAVTYRPISLTSWTCRLHRRMVNRHLIRELEPKNRSSQPSTLIMLSEQNIQSEAVTRYHSLTVFLTLKRRMIQSGSTELYICCRYLLWRSSDW
jgi:hypothetical protein